MAVCECRGEIVLGVRLMDDSDGECLCVRKKQRDEDIFVKHFKAWTVTSTVVEGLCEWALGERGR